MGFPRKPGLRINGNDVNQQKVDPVRHIQKPVGVDLPKEPQKPKGEKRI
jgi:hypothetical protein